MNTSFHRGFALLACLALTLGARADGHKPQVHDGITTSGDIITYALPVAAMSIAAYWKDGEGAWQLTKSGLITMSAAVAIKYTVKARRPNGDPYSMPSGHSAISFVSAEYLRKRYGWHYGVPAYVAASFVGYTRIRANEHYFRDVAVGGGIAFVTAYLMTTPYKGWAIQPEWSAQRRGIRLSREF